MAMDAIIDLDEVLIGWAIEKQGQDYTIDKVDTSKLQVSQKAVLYHSSQDWWRNVTVHEEYFDNDDGVPAKWFYSHKAGFQSNASWCLIRAFKSNKFVPLHINLQFPVSAENSTPLEVAFDNSNLVLRQATTGNSEWQLSSPVTVEPYSSTHACAQVRTCRLQNVVFTTDIVLSGSIKITGHKKHRKWTKHEVTFGIAEALYDKEALGFHVHDNMSDPNGPARTVIFKVEGLCTGEVGVEPLVKQDHISSLV